MSSIIRTIDSNHTLHIGDYVQFQNHKVGFIKNIIDTDSVRVMEAGISERSRHFTVRKQNCKVIPLSGSYPTKKRTIHQPPSPKVNEVKIVSENISEGTKELISVLRKSRKWTYGISNKKHPFYAYLEEKND